MLQVAMRRVKPPEQEVILSSSPPPSRGTLLQWFPQLWGWNYSTPEPPGPENKTEMELEDQILDALADSVENNTILRRDVVFGQFNFTLKQGTFNLCTASNTESDRY